MSVLGSSLLPCLKEVLGFVSSFFEILPNGTKQALHHLGIVSLKASQIPCSGAGEMARPFRSLVLLEDSVLAPSWWLAVVCDSSFRGSDPLPWPLHACGCCLRAMHRYACEQNTQTHKIQKHF